MNTPTAARVATLIGLALLARPTFGQQTGSSSPTPATYFTLRADY